jgi:predicted CopG family antitoxin
MVDSESVEPKKLSVSEAIAKLEEIRQGLSALVACLHSNIEALDEDPDVQDSLLDLQRDAEMRACSLEEEVKRLRSDVKSIKDLLGDYTEKKASDSR